MAGAELIRSDGECPDGTMGRVGTSSLDPRGLSSPPSFPPFVVLNELVHLPPPPRGDAGRGKGTRSSQTKSRARATSSTAVERQQDGQALQAGLLPPPLFRGALLRDDLRPDICVAPSASETSGLCCQTDRTAAPPPSRGLRARGGQHVLHRALPACEHR